MNLCGPALLLAALAAGPALAQEHAGPDSAACRHALNVLDAREAAASKDRAARPALETARRQAARACLGSAASAPVRPSAPAPGGGVPPQARTPIAIPVPAPAAPPAAAPRPAAPLTLTSCDATGCWASDGSRLQRVGPQLLGPQGQVCTTSGSLLHCTR